MDARTRTGPLVVGNNRLLPLVVIVGQTASGKSAAALEVARRFNGAIICADSRTVYKGMDIGTAKPTASERAEVPHYALDVVDPSQSFSAADFKRLANEAITVISTQGMLPIMVGGSGLYIDAVLFDFDFRPVADPAKRHELEQLSVEDLQQRLTEVSIPLPENARNPRHLVRALETGGALSRRKPMRENALVIGLQVPDEQLHQRIEKRVDAMIEQGFIDEVRTLSEQYGWQAPGLQAPGYKAFKEYLEGTISLDEAKALFARNDWQLARRQRTWFKRNPSIQWISDPSEVVDIVTTFLSK